MFVEMQYWNCLKGYPSNEVTLEISLILTL